MKAEGPQNAEPHHGDGARRTAQPVRGTRKKKEPRKKQ